MLDELDREVGIGRLAVVHANDSLMEFGSTRDRHQNIGDGHIGSEGFRVILGEPAFDGIAMLLEVPGIVPKLSATPGAIRHAGRRIGQDTRVVLRELVGLSEEALNKLEADGVVACNEAEPAQHVTR